MIQSGRGREGGLVDDVCSIDQYQQSVICIEMARSLKLVRPSHQPPFFPLLPG